ncbi:hypothetical protein HOLleu_19175 [Holothuria leucospilota]|uniref:Uncharacterized protein n=1 Tax=Holothuria leucospilota TaxID=206669 RepID=A0A9Q1HA76_HOLLE|nr:hypothetical protein HOLleu_19175 [Holothuria leucospilota]
MTVTEHLGGIKISDILAKDISVTNYRISKNEETLSKAEFSEGEKTHGGSDLILKGCQAPVKVKEPGESTDKRTESDKDIIDPERSKVTPDDETSNYDVSGVWHDDVDNSEYSGPSEGLSNEKESSVCSSLNEEERNIEKEHPQSDYVITEKILQKLQPPVPHVIWPENKFMTQHTAFVYGSPSRLAPVIVPVHSVDCPVSKMFLPSNRGTVCPPNSPTSFLNKEYGFYPVERHFPPSRDW